MKTTLKKVSIEKEYFCELTEVLDSILGNPNRNDRFKVYLLDTRRWDPNKFTIRVPGCSLGYVALDKNNTIIESRIEDHGLKYFNSDPNELLQKFVGEKLEFDYE